MPNDQYGIKMIYPPKAGGQEWYQDDDPENDGQIRAQEDEIIEAVSDYFVAQSDLDIKSIAVTTTSGISNTPDCNRDYSTLASRGYTFTQNDWKNTEITIFFYAQTVNLDTDRFTIFARESAGDASGDCCDSFRYGAWLYFDNSGDNTGKVAFNKRLSDGQGGALSDDNIRSQSPTVVLPNFYRRWVGMKFITYNMLGSNNQQQVRLELWLCPSDSATDKANNWTLVASQIDTGTNWGEGGDICGGLDAQAITWGAYMITIDYTGDEVRWKNWSVREIDLGGTFDPGGGGDGGGGSGNCGMTDSNGIKWMTATGTGAMIPQSRDNAGDYRWSEVFSGIGTTGYEATVIATFDGVASDGHCALKHWGGNHSGDCQYSEDGECCCWYDCGIRSNGDVQTQIERPHPSNSDWDCPECTTNNIGTEMDGSTIGLKWLVYPIVEGGNNGNGGVKLKMWVDIDPLDSSGRPTNGWELVYDITDNPSRDILPDYDAPSEQEVEMRISDTDNVDCYGGGLHMRRIQRPQDLVPCVPGGGGDGGGDGGGGGGGDPTCPTGYHWVAASQTCVADTVTPPPPPPSETLYNDFTMIYNINSDSDGCICNAPPFTPPPLPCPAGQHRDPDTGLCVPDTLPACPTGQHRDPITLLCVPDTLPPPSGTAVYDIGYSGASEQNIGNNPGSTSHYLRWGEIIRGTDNGMYNKNILRVEWPLFKVGAPTGTATILIRKGEDDSIAKTIGTFDVSQLTGSTEYVSVENTVDTYNMIVNDRLMVEYEEGDEDNYIVAWMATAEDNGAKVTRRDNDMSAGTYGDRDREAAFRAYA